MTLLVAMLGVVLPSVARAQTITIFQQQSLPRLDSSGAQVQKRPLTQNPEGVSYQDCLDDQRIRFTLQLGGFQANAALEVWAGLSGNDCSDQTRRVGNAATCWQLATGIPLQLQVDSVIPVRKIMSGVQAPQSPNEGADICGKIDRTNVTVNFLYFAPGNPGTPAARAAVEIPVDTIGPPPLSGVSVLPGNERLSVRWTAVGEGGVQDLINVRVFCAPVNEGAAGSRTQTVCNDPVEAGDGGEPEDAGCTEVETPSVACSEDAFRYEGAPEGDRVVPDKEFIERFLCGELPGSTGAGVTAREFRSTGERLRNGQTYAVAIAGTDSFGNGGQLSGVDCEFPEPTTDFWSEYKDAGGEAGGGFCSMPAGGSAAGSGVVASIGALSVLSILRRKVMRRRGARANGGKA